MSSIKMDAKKLAEIKRKVDEGKRMKECGYFDRWTGRMVGEHLLAAGKESKLRDRVYAFPGYIHFPYKLHDSQNDDHIPIKSGLNAMRELGYMLRGEVVYEEMIGEYLAYVNYHLKKINEDVLPLARRQTPANGAEASGGQPAPAPNDVAPDAEPQSPNFFQPSSPEHPVVIDTDDPMQDDRGNASARLNSPAPTPWAPELASTPIASPYAQLLAQTSALAQATGSALAQALAQTSAQTSAQASAQASASPQAPALAQPSTSAPGPIPTQAQASRSHS